MEKTRIYIRKYNDDMIDISLYIDNNNYNSKEEVIEQLSRIIEFKDYDIEYSEVDYNLLTDDSDYGYDDELERYMNGEIN